MKRILVLFLAIVMVLSMAACSKQNFSNDFTTITGLRRGMTQADIVAYEKATYGNELESISSNTLGEMVLHFGNDHHLYCLDPQTQELQYANLSMVDGDSVPELDAVMEALSKFKGKKEDSNSYDFTQWYGTVDGVKCDFMCYQKLSDDHELTVSLSFGDYGDDYTWTFYE